MTWLPLPFFGEPATTSDEVKPNHHRQQREGDSVFRAGEVMPAPFEWRASRTAGSLQDADGFQESPA